MIIENKTPKKPFNPVTIEITFESEAEIADLVKRLNISPADVNSQMSHYFPGFTCNRDTGEGLFQAIQTIAIEAGMKERKA